VSERMENYPTPGEWDKELDRLDAKLLRAVKAKDHLAEERCLKQIEEWEWGALPILV